MLFTVSISEPVRQELAIYPNPATDRVQAEYLPPAPGVYLLRLINVSRQTILQKEIRSSGMMIRTNRDVSSLP